MSNTLELSEKKIESDDKTIARRFGNNSWDSDLRIINHIIVIVPLKILLVCDQIASRIGNNEFSIVAEIKERSLERIVLSDNYYIPKQEVTETSIDYMTDDFTHPVVIHRHPNGIDKFSSIDQEYINQNFELSLLYTKQDSFVNGLYNLKIEDVIITLPVKVIIEDGIDEINLINIEQKRYSPELLDKIIDKDSISKEDTLYTENLISEITDLQHRIEMLESYFFR